MDTIKHAGRKSREKERRKRKAVKMFKINCTAKGEIEKAKETNAKHMREIKRYKKVQTVQNAEQSETQAVLKMQFRQDRKRRRGEERKGPEKRRRQMTVE